MSSELLLSLFIWFSINNFFHSEKHCFPSRTDNFQCYFHVSNLIQTFQTDLVEYSTQSSLVIQNSCSIEFPVSCQNPSGSGNTSIGGGRPFTSASSIDTIESLGHKITLTNNFLQCFSENYAGRTYLYKQNIQELCK